MMRWLKDMQYIDSNVFLVLRVIFACLRTKSKGWQKRFSQKNRKWRDACSNIYIDVDEVFW